LLEDSTLRRLETVIYAFSGTSVEGEKLSAINSYFLEISTHNKLVHFHTSKANGEPYAYDIQINTAEGFIQIQDDDGNIFKLSSADEQLSIINKSGSVVEVNKKVINFASPDEVNIKTTNYNLDCTNSTVTATSSKLTADTHVSTATVTQNGSATTNGPSVMNGGIAMNAGAAGASKMVITGDIDINGNVTNNGKAIGSTHRHGNVTNGPDTSGVPV
jgi:phage baseplate assembly protein gpV